MTITPHHFAAFLNCPTKCWLRAAGQQPTGNTYAEWFQTKAEAYRVEGINRLLSESTQVECAPSPGRCRENAGRFSAEDLKSAKWRVAVNVSLFATIQGKDLQRLLAAMSAQERQKLRKGGIFSATQLSYTFRPRRRPKRLRDKRENYHHSLKALAIREKKIYIVGSPELKIEGTPVPISTLGGSHFLSELPEALPVLGEPIPSDALSAKLPATE